MKFNCIIDTCSFIYLHRVICNRKSLLSYLKNVTNLILSPEVNVEIRDHFLDGMPSNEERKRFVKIARKHSIPEYERRIAGRTYSPRERNKGEIDNFIISIDQVHHFKRTGVIFLTDDSNCLRGVLKDCSIAFPTIKIWTSYEVVLFLYIERAIPSIDLASDAIGDLISSTAPRPVERTMEYTQKLIKLRAEYESKLKTVSKIF